MQHTVQFWYPAQLVVERDGATGEKESRDYSQTESRDNGDPYCTTTRKLSRVERARSVERYMPTEETAMTSCMVFGKTTLQLLIEEERKKPQNIIRLTYDTNFDAGEPPR